MKDSRLQPEGDGRVGCSAWLGGIPTVLAAGARDWSDGDHEHGAYWNTCIECGFKFIGHKRRVCCRVCAKSSDNMKVGMKVRRNTRTWVDAERLGIEEGMLGEVLPNTTGIGVHVLFANGVDTYCWGDDLDAVPPMSDDLKREAAGGFAAPLGSASSAQIALLIVSVCAILNGVLLSTSGDGTVWICFGVWVQASTQIWVWIVRRKSKPNAAGELQPPPNNQK